MFCTQMFGLLVEVGSRPDKRESDGYRGWCGDPVRTDALILLERKRRAYLDRKNIQRGEGSREYSYVVEELPPLTYEERNALQTYAMEYTLN